MHLGMSGFGVLLQSSVGLTPSICFGDTTLLFIEGPVQLLTAFLSLLCYLNPVYMKSRVL